MQKVLFKLRIRNVHLIRLFMIIIVSFEMPFYNSSIQIYMNVVKTYHKAPLFSSPSKYNPHTDFSKVYFCKQILSYNSLKSI